MVMSLLTNFTNRCYLVSTVDKWRVQRRSLRGYPFLLINIIPKGIACVAGGKSHPSDVVSRFRCLNQSTSGKNSDRYIGYTGQKLCLPLSLWIRHFKLALSHLLTSINFINYHLKESLVPWYGSSVKKCKWAFPSKAHRGQNYASVFNLNQSQNSWLRDYHHLSQRQH